MALYVWPTRFFLPESFPRPKIVARVTSPGTSLSGVKQVGRTDGGGLWMMDMPGICLAEPSLISAWSAWEALLDEGATAVVVGKSMGALAPAAHGQRVPEQPCASPFPVALSDFTPVGPIAATVHGAVALRASQITVRLTAGRQLRGGEDFGIEHATVGWRRYRVAEVVTVTPGSGYTDHLVNIRTPWREDAVDGVTADFNAAPSIMQVAKMTPLEDLRYGVGSVTFLETFGPYT